MTGTTSAGKIQARAADDQSATLDATRDVLYVMHTERLVCYFDEMELVVEKTQKMVQSEQTRERLLYEATRLFARKGYFGTSIADLAAAAEITKGAIYHHFESKEAVFFAVIENIRRTWESTVARRVVDSMDSITALSALFEGQTLLFKENENFCMALNAMMMEMEGVNPDFHAALQRIYSEFSEFIAGTIARGQQEQRVRSDLDPRIFALALVGTLRGAGCSRAMFERMGADFVDMMDTLKKVIIKGLEQ
jgi:TetR/AcrR family transcriptional repressor of nem operon